ncbi:MAG: hypothetical protein HY203_02525 [Nitrospirae bacterium]|nr:hypothetical protein [Nitrospirota bacterium]
MPESGFRHLYQRVVTLLESLRVPYLIVGGLATGVLGEPRLTHDVDAIVDLKTGDLDRLLPKAREEGFDFDEQAVRANIKRQGTFRLQYQNAWLDIIVSSTEFEQSAFKRKKRVQVLDVEANFPSPEDFILLKLIPGRQKDLLDVESVVARHRDKLDRAYLEQWAQKISDEMEDLRLFNMLRKLLNR